MASEIESAKDLTAAKAAGYADFGAGGFFGDSEKAWDASRANISMALKAVRVEVGGAPTAHAPVKTGEGDVGSSKFEADGLMSDEALAALKARTTRLQQAARAPLALADDEAQRRFAEALDRILDA